MKIIVSCSLNRQHTENSNYMNNSRSIYTLMVAESTQTHRDVVLIRVKPQLRTQ